MRLGLELEVGVSVGIGGGRQVEYGYIGCLKGGQYVMIARNVDAASTSYAHYASLVSEVILVALRTHPLHQRYTPD